MRFEDVVLIVFLLAMIFIVYQDVVYLTHENGAAPIADLVYRDSSAKGEGFVPTTIRK